MDANFVRYLALLAVLMLGAVLALLAVLMNKVRKIHLASYALAEDASCTRREAEALFPQIQALLALERRLGLEQSLPPLRGWAGSPDFLLAIADEVLARKPGIVMECSSGVSTLIVARCLQMNGAGHVYSLEHDPEFGTKTRKLLERHGLRDWATVLDAPLQTKHTVTPWYAEDTIPEGLPPIEMLVVDGPPSSTAPLARFPALPRLLSRMAGEFIVFVDDANREDEIEMLKRWQALFPDLKQTKVACEKGLVLLEPKDDQDTPVAS